MPWDCRQASRERREAIRAPLVAAVLERTDGVIRLAQTRDIGLRGLQLVRTDERLAPEQPIAIEFHLPDDERPIAVAVEVVFERTEEGRRATGVRFLDLSDDDEERIAAYLRRAGP